MANSPAAITEPSGRPRRDRSGRQVPVQPRGLRHHGRLPLGPEERGRFPHPGNGGEYGRGGRAPHLRSRRPARRVPLSAGNVGRLVARRVADAGERAGTHQSRRAPTPFTRPPPLQGLSPAVVRNDGLAHWRRRHAGRPRVAGVPAFECTHRTGGHRCGHGRSAGAASTAQWVVERPIRSPPGNAVFGPGAHGLAGGHGCPLANGCPTDLAHGPHRCLLWGRQRLLRPVVRCHRPRPRAAGTAATGRRPRPVRASPRGTNTRTRVGGCGSSPPSG